MNPASDTLSEDLLLAEANRYHREIADKTPVIAGAASATLTAAWWAGNQLCEARQLVREHKGHGHWEAYLEEKFEGSLVTAKRYMRLRKSFSSLNDLPHTSLYQAYRQLGMVSDERDSGDAVPRNKSPGQHMHYAQWLHAHVREALRRDGEMQRPQLKKDLAQLYSALQALYND